MSYVPECDDDVFISYSHVDNESLAEGETGWVTLLDRALTIRLQQLLGEELSVWRDPKLTGNDYFSDTLLQKLPRVAVLISIISPRYLKSEWCTKELQEFLKGVKQSGLRVESKSRVF